MSMFNTAMPSDDSDDRTVEEHGGDPERHDDPIEAVGVPETEEIDGADAESRLDRDPEDQKSATDPAYDPDEDAAG